MSQPSHFNLTIGLRSFSSQHAAYTSSFFRPPSPLSPHPTTVASPTGNANAAVFSSREGSVSSPSDRSVPLLPSPTPLRSHPPDPGTALSGDILCKRKRNAPTTGVFY